MGDLRRQLAIASHENPLLASAAVGDHPIVEPADILGVVAEKPQVAGQSSDHFVGEPSRFVHESPNLHRR